MTGDIRQPVALPTALQDLDHTTTVQSMAQSQDRQRSRLDDNVVFSVRPNSVSVNVLNDQNGDSRAAANAPRSRFRLATVLTTLYLSLFIAALNATIVTTAIPTITAALSAPNAYSWIGGTYLIANAASSPIWAKLSDIWGRKPILFTAHVTFSASSIICAAAPNINVLIAGRTVQGVASGGLILLVNIIISDLFSMRQRTLFLGMCEAIWAIAGAIGPVLGGVLTDLVSWRWCWWVNLPFCGIAGVLLIFLDVRTPRTPFMAGLKAIDWPGSLCILAVVVMVLLGLDFGGNTFPWGSPQVIPLIIVGSLCSLLFVYAERRLARHPLMPPRLFHEPSNIAALGVTCFHGITFFAGEYYLPLFFQSAQGASPLRSGLLLAPLIVLTAFFAVFTGTLIHRFGRYRELIWIGAVLFVAGYGMFIAFTPSTSIAQIVGSQLLAGAGSGALFESPLIALQAFTPQDDVATATSTFAFVRNLSLAVSVILGGTVFSNSMNARAPYLRAAGLPDDLRKRLTGNQAAANVMLSRTIQDAHQREAVREAFDWSMRNMWTMYTAFAFLALVCAVFVKARKLSREHSETITGLREGDNREAS